MPLSLIARDKGFFLAFPWGKVAERKRGRMRVILIPGLTISLLQCRARKIAARIPHQSKIKDF